MSEQQRRGRPSKGETVAYTFRVSRQASDALERIAEATGKSKTDVFESLVLGSVKDAESGAAAKLRQIADILKE